MTTQPIKSSGRKSSSSSSSPPSDNKKRAPIKSEDGAATTKSKMHKRSRSGCFTCRLRRKKCDEGRPVCRACRHLGVECEYKRPVWWQYPERRKQHKEAIKEIISNTKKETKPGQAAAKAASVDTTPSLCHSLPTPDAQSDIFAGTRAASIDSHYSPQFDIATPPDMFNSTPMMPPPQWTPMQSSPAQFSSYYSPFEVEVKTESHMLVNEMPTHKDSVISTFSAFQQPPMSGGLPTAGIEHWMSPEMLDNHNEIFREEPLNFDFFDFPHAPFSPTHQAVIGVEDEDKHLLDHFLENISRLVFPILDANQHSTALNDIILPALESNKCYLHCCLSTAAVHMKAMGQIPEGVDIDNDIMRHRFATISSLCEAFERDNDHSQTLEATLGLILFQTSVGSPNDGLPDIPWHQHFQAAHSLIEKLGLMEPEADMSSSSIADHHQRNVSFNTSLTSWIDILGSTMASSVPVFADSYRRKIENGISSGMAELMGCDDRVMYLISEIACLESLKNEGQLDSDITLCDHIRSLGTALSATEADAGEVGPVHSSTGAIRPKQLSVNITAAFRLAARIHLCSLVPDFARDQPSITALVDQLNDVWAHIPPGATGYDRSLVWPLLIGGCASTEHSEFRETYYQRFASLGPNAMMGSFGRMHELLTTVWDFNDATYAGGGRGSVHWRDVMAQKGWDCLLI